MQPLGDGIVSGQERIVETFLVQKGVFIQARDRLGGGAALRLRGVTDKKYTFKLAGRGGDKGSCQKDFPV